MKIALHDADNTKFPNLALMKLSAWHKSTGNETSIYESLLHSTYDLVYSSKVFTFTNTEKPFGTVVYGGTGYKSPMTLPDECEHIMPDYDLYECKQSYGFLTRGCIRNCEWCLVPKKEGKIRANADIDEFLAHKECILLDNNILACDHGIEQLEKIAHLGIKIDINQGIDARLIDDGIAKRLAKCKWLHPIRLACDTKYQMKDIQKAVTLLRWNNATPRAYFVYMLVRDDIEDAIERVKFLKGLDLTPYASVYRDYENKIKKTKEQEQFQRFVNRRWIFKSCTWEDYDTSMRHKNV